MVARMPAAERSIGSSLTSAERRWSLAAAISCVTVFGLGIGLGGPLLSLMLEARGIDTTLNGLNAASTFVGVIVGPLLTPRLVRGLGLRPLMIGCLAADAALFLLMKTFDGFATWLFFRGALGLFGSTLFTATEALINVTASDKQRGRVIAFYAASLSAGFGVGPLLLSLTGFHGWTPFLAGAALNLLAAVPLIFVHDATRDLGSGPRVHPLQTFLRAPEIVLAAGMFGLYETAVLALLPIWGVRIGFDARLSASALSAIYFGAIALQIPIGWLSDRMSRLAALRLCGLSGMLGAALVPLLAEATANASIPLFVLLFLWGGLTSGLYPVALSIIGDRFRNAELVSANAALITAYGLGSLVGPVIGGAAMDVWNPHGLLVVLALIFALFLAITFAGQRVRGTA
jgi:MFS family permease